MAKWKWLLMQKKWLGMAQLWMEMQFTDLSSRICDTPKKTLSCLACHHSYSIPPDFWVKHGETAPHSSRIAQRNSPPPRASAPHDAILVQGVVLVKPRPGGFQLDGLQGRSAFRQGRPNHLLGESPVAIEWWLNQGEIHRKP